MDTFTSVALRYLIRSFRQLLLGFALLTPTYAGSQLHHGTDVPIFIEDQPLTRGDWKKELIENLVKKGDVLLLHDQFGLNSFGDDAWRLAA